MQFGETYKQALRGLFTSGTSPPDHDRETQEKVGGKQGLNPASSLDVHLTCGA
jgi:hypothetical protein